ncbi:tetratricopeptide repeat protein [Phycisphaeraceae bacterium D3-23]
MDSKKRHELETNDLREFLDNFKDFWDKNGNTILIALIIVVGGLAAMRWYKNKQVATVNDAAHALETATNGEFLLSVAADHPSVRHIALLRAGDSFLEEARLARVAGEDDDAEEHLENAANAYASVVGEEKSPAEFRISAYLGSATVAEELGDWDKAKAAYTQASELAGDRFIRLATLAKAGLDRLDSLGVAVPFGPEEVAAPQTPPGQPFNPDDFNLDDIDDDGVPDRIQRPEQDPADPLFPGGDPLNPSPDPGNDPLNPGGLPGGLGDPLGGDPEDGADTPPAIDPLLNPTGGE